MVGVCSSVSYTECQVLVNFIVFLYINVNGWSVIVCHLN